MILLKKIQLQINETKQDTTETKRNERQQKRNETKKNLSINKKNKQTLTKRFFLHETTIHKMAVAIEKPLKFTGRFGYGRRK